MASKLSCGIIRDLLPSYVDGLTCGETNAAVEEHVNDCKECEEILQTMKDPQMQEEEVPEVDYLKRVRRHGNRKALLTGLLLVGITLVALGIRFFYIGNEAEASDIAYQTEYENDQLVIKGFLTSSGMGISRVSVKQEGDNLELKVFTTLKTFFNSGDFQIIRPSMEGISRVSLGGLILWEDGKIISRTAARLYEARNPYVGDMSANAQIANILFDRTNQQFDVWKSLNLLEKYGGFRNELYTSKPPYGWHLELEEEQKGNPEELYMEMRADACMMMATIENLNYVGWEFEAGDEKYEYKFFDEDATEFTGKDIKSWAGSAASLQELCELLNIK